MSRYWTDDELEKLRAGAGKQTNVELSTMLGRSVEAVAQKASRCGIKLLNRFGDEYTEPIRCLLRGSDEPLTADQIVVRLERAGILPPEVIARNPVVIRHRLSEYARSYPSKLVRTKNAKGENVYSLPEGS
jgi:hypothetical protein